MLASSRPTAGESTRPEDYQSASSQALFIVTLVNQPGYDRYMQYLGAMRATSAGAELVSALRRHPIFADCQDAILCSLGTTGTKYTAPRGSVVASATSRFPHLLLVCTGILSMAVSCDGPTRGVRNIQLFEARAGDVIGELAFLEDSAPLGDVVVASKHATYALFPSNAIERALEGNPLLMRRLALHAARHARTIAQRLIGAQGFNAVSRVALALLPFASEGEGLQPAQRELSEMTHRQLAAAASCVKETAARAIGQLELAGALQRKQGHIRYLDRDLLVEHASGASTAPGSSRLNS